MDEIKDRLILVTLRSANKQRDDAVRYGALKCLINISIALIFISGTFGIYLTSTFLNGGYILPLFINISFMVCVLISLKVLKKIIHYPHCPAISFDEIEAMKELSIPTPLINKTMENVLVGTVDDHRAVEIADRIINRVAKDKPSERD